VIQETLCIKSRKSLIASLKNSHQSVVAPSELIYISFAKMLKTAKKKDTDPSDNAQHASGKVSVVAQELKFAKMLASNDVKIRNGVLKSLKKWLATRSQSSYRKYLLIASFIVTHSDGCLMTDMEKVRDFPKKKLFGKIFLIIFEYSECVSFVN
jgi:Nucleolar protein,Nop52